jgi:hypothetical protein
MNIESVYFDGGNNTTNRILDVLVGDGDNGEIRTDDNGDPDVRFHSTDYGQPSMDCAQHHYFSG